MSNIRVVHGAEESWTDEQVRIVNEGMEKTNASVPPVDGTFDSFLVLDGDTPFGVFTIIPTGQENAVEVGARFWEDRPINAFIMARALKELFDSYDYVLARCYANNMKVRHLLQRGAFILLGVQSSGKRTLHVYGCRKIDFERVMPTRRFS